jgi:phosphoglycerol transferase MdoB-like AlkP superfamily enzyme
MAYGQLSFNLFPLRWSNAYFSPHRDLVLLALNPAQNLYDSWRALRAVPPDMTAARAAYPRMAPWLGVKHPDAATLNYWRLETGRPAPPEGRPNIVIIQMESLGAPRTSLASGLFAPDHAAPDPGPEDPTPNLRRLAADSLYFPWFAAPTRTTARAVFTTITGIPDVNHSGGVSARNPALVDQFSIMSEFKGYDLTYMIGGSASWANIRGILTHNIPGLKLLEEGAWKSPNVDVWGISDLALLRESAAYYDVCPKPFFSYIQTAGFHFPWTIPKDNAGFFGKKVSDEVVRQYGFEHEDAYHSMRFADHALGEFLRIAKAGAWFNNTVFVIMGDHGLTQPSSNVPEGYLACNLQSNHVPLLIHAPGLPHLVRPGISGLPSGQPDLLPTLAELAGIAYRNHGLGRSLLDPERIRAGQEGREHLFLGGDSEDAARLIQNGYCYDRNEGGEALYLIGGSGENLLRREPERAAAMRRIADDTFHTAKYLLFNNRKASAPPLP